MIYIPFSNGSRQSLSSNLLAADTTSIQLTSFGQPWNYCLGPNTISGTFVAYRYFTIVDDEDNPTKWERVKVTAWAGSAPNYNVDLERNIDSSTGLAMDFDAGAVILFSIGPEELAHTNMINLSCAGEMTVLPTEEKFFCNGNAIPDNNVGNREWTNHYDCSFIFRQFVYNVFAESLSSNATVKIYRNGTYIGGTIPSSTGTKTATFTSEITIARGDRISWSVDAPAGTGSITITSFSIWAWADIST